MCCTEKGEKIASGTDRLEIIEDDVSIEEGHHHQVGGIRVEVPLPALQLL